MTIVPLAKGAGLSMAQLAVAWVLQNDNVASAIIGATRPEQVQDNAAASGVTLGDELLTKIDKILDPVIERDLPERWTVPPRPALPEPTALVLGQGQFG